MKFDLGDKVLCPMHGDEEFEIEYIDDKFKQLPYRIASSGGGIPKWWVKESSLSAIVVVPELVRVSVEKLRPLDIIYSPNVTDFGASAFILIEKCMRPSRVKSWKAMRLHETPRGERGSTRSMGDELLKQYYLADNMGDIADVLMEPNGSNSD